MSEPVYVPILLDVDIPEEEELEIDGTIVIGAGGNLPPGGDQGDIIVKRSSRNFDATWATPASSVEEDNTLPITAAAVYREVGNINALLATI